MREKGGVTLTGCCHSQAASASCGAPVYCRDLLLGAASAGEWTPERNRHWPPAFRQAAQTLLLVNSCRGFGRAGVEGEAQARRLVYFTLPQADSFLPPGIIH